MSTIFLNIKQLLYAVGKFIRQIDGALPDVVSYTAGLSAICGFMAKQQRSNAAIISNFSTNSLEKQVHTGSVR